VTLTLENATAKFVSWECVKTAVSQTVLPKGTDCEVNEAAGRQTYSDAQGPGGGGGGEGGRLFSPLGGSGGSLKGGGGEAKSVGRLGGSLRGGGGLKLFWLKGGSTTGGLTGFEHP